VTLAGVAGFAWTQQSNGSWVGDDIMDANIPNPTFSGLNLGQYNYWVDFMPAFSPLPSSTATPISTQLEVWPTNIPTPEPGSWALAATGLPVIGFIFRRRRLHHQTA
jgi:hypothetical protein